MLVQAFEVRGYLSTKRKGMKNTRVAPTVACYEVKWSAIERHMAPPPDRRVCLSPTMMHCSFALEMATLTRRGSSMNPLSL